MAITFPKINESDYADKGVRLLPDRPAVETHVLKREFDELSLDVIIPKINELADVLQKAFGTTDISAIGDGTVTGGLNTINDKVNTHRQVFYSGGDGKAQVLADNGLGVWNSDASAWSPVKASDVLINGSESVSDNFHTYTLPIVAPADNTALLEYLDSGCLPSDMYTLYRRHISVNFTPSILGSGGSYVLDGFTGRGNYQWQRMTIYNTNKGVAVWERTMANSVWGSWIERVAKTDIQALKARIAALETALASATSETE